MRRLGRETRATWIVTSSSTPRTSCCTAIRTHRWKDEVRGFYEGIFAAISDIALEIHGVVEDGSPLGCRFTMHGTHTGEMAGIAPTGRRIAQPGLTIMRFEGGKVVERHSVADFGAVISQLTAE